MKLIKRMALIVKIRALETTIDGQSTCLEYVRDPETINKIVMAQINARNELRKCRKSLRELRGERANSWRIAL